MATSLEACYFPAAAAKSLQSCPTVQPHRRQPTRLLRPWDSPSKNIGVGCHFLLQCMKVKSEIAKSCLTLTDPMDCSLPGSSVHGIFQQEYWSGLPFPSPMRESEVTQSCPTLSDPIDCSLPGSSVHGIFQQEYWSGVPLPSLILLLALLFSLHAFLLFHSLLVYKWKTCNDITTALFFGLNSSSLWLKPQGFQS